MSEKKGEKTKAADELQAILEVVSDGIFVVDKGLILRKYSRRAEEITGVPVREAIGQPCREVMRADVCDTACPIREAMRTGEQVVDRLVRFRRPDGTMIPIAVSAASLKDAKGNVLGGVEHVRDLTVHETVAQAQRTVLELSTPVIKMWDGVLLLPLIGTVDTVRSQQIVENLLDAIVKHQARVVILDMTGIAVVDTQVAQSMMKAVTSAQMLGAAMIVTGISPEIAQTVVKLGIDLSDVQFQGLLQGAVEKALSMVGLTITSREPEAE